MTGRGVHVAMLSEIPAGTMKRVTVGETPVLLVNTGGRLSAVAASCSHENQPLEEGYLTDTTLVCGYHGSEFDLLTGAALGPPAEDPLDVYAVTADGERIYVDIPSSGE